MDDKLHVVILMVILLLPEVQIMVCEFSLKQQVHLKESYLIRNMVILIGSLIARY